MTLLFPEKVKQSDTPGAPEVRVLHFSPQLGPSVNISQLGSSVNSPTVTFGQHRLDTMDALESAALSGALFQTHRSPSPARSASTASPTPSHSSLNLEQDTHPRNPKQDYIDSPPDSPIPRPNSNLSNSKLGSAQTGPKGVISDQKARDRLLKLKADNDIRELVYRQQRAAIVGLTIEEEEEVRRKEGEREGKSKIKGKGKGEEESEEIQDDELKEWRRKRLDELESDNVRKKGGLREVGKEGFVNAVERDGWVVVLIYEPVCSFTFTIPGILLTFRKN